MTFSIQIIGFRPQNKYNVNQEKTWLQRWNQRTLCFRVWLKNHLKNALASIVPTHIQPTKHQSTVVLVEHGVVFPFPSSESHERHTTETPSDLIARNSGNLWVNDPSCVSIYFDWSKLQSLRSDRLKRGERGEEKADNHKKSRKGDEKKCFNDILLMFTAFIWAQRYTTNNSQRKKHEKRETSPCDQRHDPGEEVVSSCWLAWEEHYNLTHSATTTLLLTFDPQ